MARTEWQQMVDTTNKQILAQERAGITTSQFMIQLKRLADKPGMEGAIRILPDGRIRLSTAKKFESLLKKPLETLRQYKSYGMKVARESQKKYEQRHEKLKAEYGMNDEQMDLFYKIMNKMELKRNKEKKLESNQVKSVINMTNISDYEDTIGTMKTLAQGDLELLKMIEELEEKIQEERKKLEDQEPVFTKK